MSTLAEQGARGVKRLVEGLLAAAGVVLMFLAFGGRFSIGLFAIGVALLVVGAGVWARDRWARWLALGVCFLMVLNAWVMPIVIFVILPTQAGHSAVRNITWGAAAVVFGVIGYKGLAYLRSHLGRFEFGATPAGREQLYAEGSSAVAYSAGLWVVLFALALWAHPPRKAPAFADGVPPPHGYGSIEEVRVRAREEKLPDLVPIGMCALPLDQLQAIYVAYVNAGSGGSPKPFRARIADGWDAQMHPASDEYRVPEPGRMDTVFVSTSYSESRRFVFVNLDPQLEIAEADHDNNAALFALPRRDDGTFALPDCDSMPVVMPPPRPARRTAPELVALGLCRNGADLVSLRFTNLGGVDSGPFHISEGRTADALTTGPLFVSIPRYGEIRGFDLSLAPRLIARHGARAEIYAQLDALDGIHESDEGNNLAGGRVRDLPGCEALDTQYLTTREVDDSAMQPAFVSLPDLAPLGLCRSARSASDGSRWAYVVYGNLGKGSRPGTLQLTSRILDQVHASGYSSGFEVPAPGTAQIAPASLLAHPDARSVEIRVYSPATIAETNEANNVARFDLPRKPDGDLDLPTCAPVPVPVKDWLE